MTCSEELADVAVAALEEGLDSPALRVLAGLSPDEANEARRVLERALAELAEGDVFVPNVWEVGTSEYPFKRLKRDHAWNGIGPSVCWDPDAKWVVVVSDEGHGVISLASLRS